MSENVLTSEETEYVKRRLRDAPVVRLLRNYSGCPDCGEKIIVTRAGRIFPYPHYDVYFECPNRCLFDRKTESADDVLMKEYNSYFSSNSDEEKTE